MMCSLWFRRVRIVLYALACFLWAGCSNADSRDEKTVLPFDPASLKERQDVLPVSWDDLLPEGEEAEIARQQTEFYTELNRKMVAKGGTQTLADLGAKGGYAAIEEGSALDFMPQLGTYNVVDDLDRVNVRIPGFIVPLQATRSESYTQFLLVPYFGACIHLPPPPPNQIILVASSVPVRIDQLDRPYYVQGVLSADRQEGDLGNSAYSMTLDSVMYYEE